MFEIPAALLSWFYGFTTSYTIAIGLMAVVVIAITTPLTLKSTKGMLEMQRLEPELHQLQDEYRNDRVRLNEEMRKLYQEHKINPAVRRFCRCWRRPQCSSSCSGFFAV